jgi:hypothetical protein
MTEAGQGSRVEIRFRAARTLTPFAIVALEDYARELTRAAAAEALVAEDAGERLLGLSLEAPLIAPQGIVLDDIEAFARELAERAGDGLGWS